MKRFSDFIIEKLKVTTKSSDITLEELIKALKDYKDRKHYEYSIYIDLNEIFDEYPVVLEYHGTKANKNIIGNEILGLRYNKVQSSGEDEVFIYFNPFVGDSIQIENTEELNDIFGEDVLNKIYNYLKQ